ncbi:hypothetical protein BC941DRAFT_456922 [Chlamydoabsidia padenii]|nr:hypothetical protein BC941DRAFT_456922 [Chlamydoabsidia padenii]
MDVFEPARDGNCGFRCLAKSIYDKKKGTTNNQDKYGDVKVSMFDYLKEKSHFYISTKFFNQDQVDKLEAITSFRGDNGTPSSLWFEAPDCAQLAADTFRVPIEIHSKEGSTLYLPLTNTRYQSYSPIILQLYQDHFYLVKLSQVFKFMQDLLIIF